MKKPIVSILTTVYNREKYLAECIESVQKGHFQDYEHIIVDDRSSDRSLEIAHEYAAKDDRIRMYQNETNLGDYPNRNQAASYATGKYIKYLDADDMLTNFMLEIMVHAMEEHPTAAVGLFDHSRVKPVYPLLISPRETYLKSFNGQYDFIHRSPLGAIINREIFNREGGFCDERMTGDFELWLRLGARYPIVLIPGGAPGYYREHEEQEMTLHSSDCIWPLKYEILSLAKLTSPDCPLDKDESQLHSWAQKRKIARTILYGIKRHGVKDAIKMQRYSQLSWFSIVKNAFAPLN